MRINVGTCILMDHLGTYRVPIEWIIRMEDRFGVVIGMVLQKLCLSGKKYRRIQAGIIVRPHMYRLHQIFVQVVAELGNTSTKRGKNTLKRNHDDPVM